MDARGCFVEARKIKANGITTKLKPKFKHMVLVLDTIEKNTEYEKVHAMDSLNSLGWCQFDEIKACLGEEAAMKVVKYCEGLRRKEAKIK